MLKGVRLAQSCRRHTTLSLFPMHFLLSYPALKLRAVPSLLGGRNAELIPSFAPPLTDRTFSVTGKENKETSNG